MSIILSTSICSLRLFGCKLVLVKVGLVRVVVTTVFTGAAAVEGVVVAFFSALAAPFALAGPLDIIIFFSKIFIYSKIQH